MSPPVLLVLVFGACLAVAALATRLALGVLTRRGIVDQPNHRSSHDRPVPRGGGWGVVLAVLPAWALLGLYGNGGPAIPALIAGSLLLVGVSWRDDLHSVPAGLRLLAQALAIGLGLGALPPDVVVFQDMLPLWLDRAICFFGWLWFVNLYNFMDGIDGISAVETLSIAAGIVAIALLAGRLGAPEAALTAALAGAVLGFAVFNWHPARIFLGDVGSVPLGYLAGWLLLDLAARGEWAAALLLPAYYLADATLTLLVRSARGARVWQAHREHAYQRAVAAGWRHDRVSLLILAGNAVLIGLAIAAALPDGPPDAALLAGGAVVAVGLLVALRRMAARPPR